jgi:hypothetical protein
VPPCRLWDDSGSGDNALVLSITRFERLFFGAKPN